MNKDYKDYIVRYKGNLRNKKDHLKALLKTANLNESSSQYSITIPKLLFHPSLELQSDQWYWNGFVINCKDKLIVVDPGSDFYSRFTTTGLSAANIRAIIVSHNHIDHLASLQIFLEKILKNPSKSIDLFITQDTYDTKVPTYYREQLAKTNHIRLVLLKDNKQPQSNTILGSYDIEFLPLFHSAPDTFGFKLNIESKKLAYVSDTGYAITVKTDQGSFPAKEVRGTFVAIEEKRSYIKEFFRNIDTALVNINDLQYNRHSEYHLSGWDVLDIFGGSEVKNVILQHISPIDADGEDSNYLYKLFFDGEKYTVTLPHFAGRKVDI